MLLPLLILDLLVFRDLRLFDILLLLSVVVSVDVVLLTIGPPPELLIGAAVGAKNGAGGNVVGDGVSGMVVWATGGSVGSIAVTGDGVSIDCVGA